MLKQLLRQILHATFIPAAVCALAAAGAGTAGAGAGAGAGVTGAEEANRDSLVLAQNALYGRPVREIAIAGAKHTKEYVIRRELVSRIGEPYLEANAALDVEKLTRLGIFSSVEVFGRASGDSVMLTIDVVETFRFLPVASISISDENGVSIGGGVKMLNLGGHATYLSAVARFGGANSIQFTLENPWVTGNHLSYHTHYNHLHCFFLLFSPSNHLFGSLKQSFGLCSHFLASISFFFAKSSTRQQIFPLSS